MYYIYVLQSRKDKKYYYGMTTNLEIRVKQHNEGKVRSTKSRRPLKLVYYEEVKTRKEARSKEKYFKSGFGRKYIKNKMKLMGPIV